MSKTAVVLEDQMHRLTNTLGLPPSPPISFENLGEIVIDPTKLPRYIAELFSQTNNPIAIFAPENRVWIVQSAYIKYQADSNVADRSVQVHLYRKSDGQIFYTFFGETIAADAKHESQIGSPAPSANGPAYDHADAHPVLTDNIGLRLRAAANGQAGDTLDVRLIVKEVLNFEP